ncbi:radical SAM/SPASM domain-containing protein [Burkholderia cepacia]|uniref:radical SAM/SPASM domain-containing protein n=1 Tax=Burkholderia cepacia TaxID=292 RepID=UPI00299E8D79|nr:radical SAM protein [Burkholderia cepacia]
MRVAASIRLLRGARRAAVYDISRGLCWPASESEVAALETLASGKYPVTATATLSSMRMKGWLITGAPRVHALSIDSLLRSAPKVLEHAWLELTNSCNLKCNHCYASSGPDVDRSAEMPTQEWLAIVDDLMNFGVRKLTFIGGEPTIRLDLVDEISSHVRLMDSGILLRMFSNLSIQRLRKQTIETVSKHKIEFGTALYGIDDVTHDRMTQRKGSWAATLEAIRECVNADVDVFVGLYLNMLELDSISQQEAWLRNIGVKRYQILAPSKVGRGTAVEWKKTPKKNRLPGVLAFSEHQWEVSRIGHNCFHDHIAIMPDGNVSPCIMSRSVSYGNITESGIRGILSSTSFEAMAALSKDKIPGCRDCEFRYACFDCRPDAMKGTDDVLRKPQCGYDPRLSIGDVIDDSV